MKLEFSLQAVKVTEFGVGLDSGNGEVFLAVPVDSGVQRAIREMVQATWNAMESHEDGPVLYQPSEKYGSTEYLYMPLDDDLTASVRRVHEAKNLELDESALVDPSGVFCYFARLTDREGRRLTALRRAAHFKGILKSRNRLVRMWDDTLQMIDEPIFKLDNDFDLLIDSKNVYVLRPSGFEFAGKLQQAILDAVSTNVKAVQQDLPFIDFKNIEAYACERPRAARYLASIRTRQQVKDIDRYLLNQLCTHTGVKISDSNGKLTVADGHEMNLLEVLDRRRYPVELVKEQVELYRATSRTKLNG